MKIMASIAILLLAQLSMAATPDMEQKALELAEKTHAKTLYPQVGVMMGLTEDGEPSLISFLSTNVLGACSDRGSCEKAGSQACQSVHQCGVRSGSGQIEDLAAGNGQSCSGDCACNNASFLIYCFSPKSIIDEPDAIGQRR